MSGSVGKKGDERKGILGTVKMDEVENTMEWNRMEWNETEWNGIE